MNQKLLNNVVNRLQSSLKNVSTLSEYEFLILPREISEISDGVYRVSVTIPNVSNVGYVTIDIDKDDAKELGGKVLSLFNQGHTQLLLIGGSAAFRGSVEMSLLFDEQEGVCTIESVQSDLKCLIYNPKLCMMNNFGVTADLGINERFVEICAIAATNGLQSIFSNNLLSNFSFEISLDEHFVDISKLNNSIEMICQYVDRTKVQLNNMKDWEIYTNKRLGQEQDLDPKLYVTNVSNQIIKKIQDCSSVQQLLDKEIRSLLTDKNVRGKEIANNLILIVNQAKKYLEYAHYKALGHLESMPYCKNNEIHDEHVSYIDMINKDLTTYHSQIEGLLEFSKVGKK